MNKELCFKIGNISLYLEQTLVDYMDITIFFLCRGEEQYYIALCTDIDDLNYIVVKLSLSDAYNLLHGKIPMRDAILKQKEYWNIISGDEICLDTVTCMSIDTLDNDLLPEKNACFKILTKQIEVFVQQFDCEFFAAKHFRDSDKKADLSDWNVEASLDVLTERIEQFTELVDYKMEKPLVSTVPSYDEKMNAIKTAEVTIKKSEQTKDTVTSKWFKLSVSCVNSVAVAA